MGGLMWVTGMPGGGPVRAGIAVADMSAGIYAATGILIALAERERSGRGQWVQTSLLEAQIALMDFQAARYLIDGIVPGQAGNAHPYSTPMGVFETSDGFINIGVGGDGQWRALCVALERPDLGKAPEYATLDVRFRNRPKLTATLSEVFKTKSSSHWLDKLEQQGVPAGPIYKLDEVFADPQVEHLGIAAPLQHPTRGDIRVVGQPIGLSRTPASVDTTLAELGAHTDEILRDAGYSNAEIADFHARKIV
jgi:crotonobetainyl-CoA:carnitine CoA-transferase CaiB-like acyl-CoA transferase